MVAPLRKGYDDLGESLTTIDGDADALASATAALERQVAAFEPVRPANARGRAQ
jgi:hypothetical protein